MAKQIEKFAHPEYLKHLPDWERIRDCFNGERAIKVAAEKYLPRLENQSQRDYENYLQRALFFPITGKTVTSMVGLATSKKPKIEAPETMSFYFSDTDSDQYQFTEFYVGLFNEVVLQGRYGVLIDAPEGAEGRAEPCVYIAENIVNWSHDRGVLTMLLLREYVQQVSADDPFDIATVVQYRHCFLRNGVYHQEVLDDELKSVPGKAIITPTFTGRTIDFIPFTCIGSSGVHMSVDKPPMLDISTINISHYMTSADLEWGRHLVGLPTPWATGVDAGTQLKIGGLTAWILPPAEAKCGYLEFEGQGLQSLEKAMTDKIGLMSTLSARLVDSSSKGSEAAEAVRLRYINEAAGLIHIIGSIETGMTLVYNMLAKLLREGPVKISFPRDVLGAAITFSDMEVLFNAYLEGSISVETLVYNLRRLDALDPNTEDPAEIEAIKAAGKLMAELKAKAAAKQSQADPAKPAAKE